MGGGLCWLDYDGDGWLDLFVVNSFGEGDIGAYSARGGLPRTALFHNVHGRFVDVSARSGAGRAVRGEGCVAADFNGDGRTDLYVTTAQSDELLWNDGDGTFTEGARSHGVVSFGWHAGAAVADVNGDGRPDLFVAGYTEQNGAIPTSTAGFPTNHLGVRDLLFLNLGNGRDGRARFREVGRQVGLDPAPYDHSLGAVFTDANARRAARPLRRERRGSEPPLRQRAGRAARRPLRRFRRRRRGRGSKRRHGRGRGGRRTSSSPTRATRGTPSSAARDAASSPAPAASLPTNVTAGWGAGWVDLANSGRLDLVVANGSIPVTNLRRDARRIQVLVPRGSSFVDAGLLQGLRVNGRGLAAADFDNDGRVDVAVNTIGGRLLLLRNTGAAGHWLEVRLGRFAPGAIVEARLPDGRVLSREVQAGSSYLSSGDPRVHLGLGKATRVTELAVSFPGGRKVTLRDVPADRIVAVG